MAHQLLLVAGEVSGDQHAAALLEKLGALRHLDVFGLAGDRCAQLGMELLAHQRQLAVVGLVEALGKIRFARRLAKTLVSEAVARKAAGAILIDSPDFNLPLARKLKKAGIPVVFYVSPQVWAWRSRRARKLVDRGRAILALFDFEKRWYDQRGLGEKVTWVGHPLVDAAQEELQAGTDKHAENRKRVLLMPGSREGEIRSLLPMFTQAVRLLKERHPEIEVALIRADSISQVLLEELAGPDIHSWTMISGPHLALLAASGVLVVASGTATVEGLLTSIPMVVVYRVHRVTFRLAKWLVKVPHIAMANIVSDPGTGEKAVPELIQSDATPQRIAEEVARFLEDPDLVARTRKSLQRGAKGLGPPGAASRTAEAVIQALGLSEGG